MKPRSRAGLFVRPRGDAFVLLDAGDNVLYDLDPVAAAVWSLCDGTRTAEEIVTQVARTLDVDAAKPLVGDVAEAILRFDEAGLLAQ